VLACSYQKIMSSSKKDDALNESNHSLRLSIKSVLARSSSNVEAATSTPATASKKRSFEPPPPAPQDFTTSARDVTVVHQRTRLHWVLHDALPGSTDNSVGTWQGMGVSSLYLILPKGASEIALHLRGCNQVTAAKVETLVPTFEEDEEASYGRGNRRPKPKLTDEDTPLTRPTAFSLQAVPNVSFFHEDPLEHVVVRPASLYTVPDTASSQYQFDADAHCSRGGAGWTSSLRAAAIAANHGELRLQTDWSEPAGAAAASLAPLRAAAWQQDVAALDDMGQAAAELVPRPGPDQARRVATLAEQLAAAAGQAQKVTIYYRLLHNTGSVSPVVNLGGLQARTTDATPLIYTASGSWGDYEGPRCWLPCLDSAAYSHRATHEMTIYATAAYTHGLSICGFGTSRGRSTAVVSAQVNSTAQLKRVLGQEHVDLMRCAPTASDGAAHVIPPSDLTIHNLQVTSIWTTASWTPVGVRSLGFCIGPFKVLEDAEYFGLLAPEDDEEEDDEEEEEEAKDDAAATTRRAREARHRSFVEAARRHGEGIRQVYLCPVRERPLVHYQADRRLLPNLHLLGGPSAPVEQSAALERTVACCTVGVPHRAWSLMRDVLALPAFCSTSYTQIWIPGAVHGGITCGALADCPEVSLNIFMGGAILDARLLPPVGVAQLLLLVYSTVRWPGFSARIRD
jgi:hypothetical protein